jgi:hypothetical protein
MGRCAAGYSAQVTRGQGTGEAQSCRVNIFICHTDPQTSVPTTILTNETPTFGVFVAGAGDVAFVPETNRIFVRFKDSGGATRGLTSVAVRTQ